MKGKAAKKRFFCLHVSVPLALNVAKADRLLVSGIKRIADNAKPKRFGGCDLFVGRLLSSCRGRSCQSA